MCRCHLRVSKRRVALQLLDHAFIFFTRLDAGHTDRNDFNAAQVFPLIRKLFVQDCCQIIRMSRHLRITNALCRDFREGRLQCCQKLGFELGIDAFSVIRVLYIRADVGVEANRIDDMVAVLAKALNGDIHIQTDVFVHNAERDCTCCAIFIPHQLFCVEIIHALVLWRFSAEGETFPDVAETFFQAFAELAGKDARLGGIVKDEFTRLRADLYNLALLHDHHKLSVRDRDDRTAADDIVGTLGVGGASADSLFALNRDDVFRHGFTIKILLPLVGQVPADCSQSCFD